ncbi:hypothetical protein KAR48_03690, partial [bacterium]|nr:hypothetical protein [bacterium]
MKKYFLFVFLLLLFAAGCSKNPAEPVRDNPYDEGAMLSAAPLLMAPNNEQDVNPDQFVLSWGNVSNTEAYALWISASDSTVQKQNTMFDTLITGIFQEIVNYTINKFTYVDTIINYYWRVRVVEPDSGRWSAVRAFRITEQPAITVTAPNGGENWEVGSTQSIAWTSNKTSGNVKIEYSSDNGTSWSDIIASTTD